MKELVDQLEAEIRDLEMKQARLEAALEEKRGLLVRLKGSRENLLKVPTRGPKSITALGPHIYEFSGQQFKNAGLLLDCLRVPHYFSPKNGGKGDTATREILRWAKKNPVQSGNVTVILANGTRMSLYEAVKRIWP